jgi:hypothetical protein
MKKALKTHLTRSSNCSDHRRHLHLYNKQQPSLAIALCTHSHSGTERQLDSFHALLHQSRVLTYILSTWKCTGDYSLPFWNLYRVPFAATPCLLAVEQINFRIGSLPHTSEPPRGEVGKQMSFDALVLQEKNRLEKLHPTPEDIPSCMKLLDDFMTCNSECASRRLPPSQQLFCQSWAHSCALCIDMAISLSVVRSWRTLSSVQACGR